ncbi:MAG TPA: hypothetical protein VG271_08955 [Beijerinckiaceae bacterium]|nr:hypothetical protein [Beijerinckiaceae bacterium]
MSKPLVTLATPCFGGVVTQAYMTSVLELTKQAAGAGFDLDVLLLGGDSLISRARSVLVSRFLDNLSATHLLFVDADISFDCEQVLRLLRFDRDFAACFYPVKKIHWRDLPARVVGGERLETSGLSYVGQLRAEPDCRREEGFATAEYAGTGFQLIKRMVFERMTAAYPELKFKAVHVETDGMASTGNLCALFDCIIDPETGTYLSEDYSFCRRWRAIGGEIWLDLHSKLTHSGVQHFSGDYEARFHRPASSPQENPEPR